MKIVNNLEESKSDDDIWFDGIKCTYSQELDSMQEENDYRDSKGRLERVQVLTLEGIDGEGGKFFRLTTGSAGWSFDSIDSLIKVLNHFKEKAEI